MFGRIHSMKATRPAFALWEGFCQVKQSLSNTSLDALLFGKQITGEQTSSDAFRQFIISAQQAAWAPCPQSQKGDTEGDTMHRMSCVTAEEY